MYAFYLYIGLARDKLLTAEGSKKHFIGPNEI